CRPRCLQEKLAVGLARLESSEVPRRRALRGLCRPGCGARRTGCRRRADRWLSYGRMNVENVIAPQGELNSKLVDPAIHNPNASKLRGGRLALPYVEDRRFPEVATALRTPSSSRSERARKSR